MKELKLDATWREELVVQRKRIGEFACYVSWIYGVFARVSHLKISKRQQFFCILLSFFMI